MPNDNQNRQKLYNGLKEDGKFTGTYEEFSTKFADPNNRQFLYDGLLEDGDYTGSVEDFNTKFFQDAPQQTGLKKNTEETQMQTQGEEVPPQSNTKSPNYVGDFFSQFGSVDDIARSTNHVEKKPADK